ncbi:MAG: excinuclease ABC subunit UvrC [Candidatus Peribacteraceae bacterium]
MSESKNLLSKRVSRVTTDSGVYRWLDKKGEVLYVGKAKNLRKRMHTYVAGKAKNSAWTEIMVRQIADFEVTVVKSELEAFMLESNLIKELKPKYNIMLKDDKGYVYVRVSTHERYPRVEIVRRIGTDKARYFGPFTTGSQITERTVEMLDSILRFRACGQSLDALNTGKTLAGTPCLDHQIGRCIGLCIGSVSEEEYLRRIKAVISFFRGNLADVKRETVLAMKAAAEDKKFEKAARLRDALSFIEDLEKRQSISDTSGEDIDVFGLAARAGKWQAVVLRQRDGRLIQELSFALRGDAETVPDALSQLIAQFYTETTDVPSMLLIGEPILDQEVLEEWLTGMKGTGVKIRVPERGRKSALLTMAEKNADEKVQQQFAAWESEARKVEDALAGLTKILSLSEKPKRIEGYDISHLGGTATVGSMVVFENGKPKREHYRSFNITTVREGDIDDYKSLAEVLRRRLKYLTDDLKTLEAKWQEKGVTIGKAKKAEQPFIVDTSTKNEDTISADNISYKDYLVVRAQDQIIGFGRLFAYDGVMALRSVWLEERYRGQQLGAFLVRSLLAKVKKGKIYVQSMPSLVEWYQSLGFQIVREPPEVLRKKRELWQSSHPDQIAGEIMVYIVHKQKPEASFTSHPDLLLIDGGKGQLSAVVSVLDELEMTIPVAGLAKREEEIFLPGQSLPEVVPKDSEARFLLQRVRDEAHRFANSKREKRLAAVLTQSAVDDMAGIGDITKAKLVQKFGSLAKAKNASEEQLAEVLTERQLKEFRKSD